MVVLAYLKKTKKVLCYVMKFLHWQGYYSVSRLIHMYPLAVYYIDKPTKKERPLY